MGYTKEDLAAFKRAADEGRAIYEAKRKAGLIMTPEERISRAESLGIKVIKGGKQHGEERPGH